jgi:RNA polymerase sigma-70 factor (ECF subfamily)
VGVEVWATAILPGSVMAGDSQDRDAQDGDDHDRDDWRERAAAGDPQASRQLIERLYPLVAKIVRAYVPRDICQEDWEQEVFMRVFARLDQFRSDAPLEHWVSRIAVNVCVDALRTRRRRRELRWADLSPQEAELVRGAAAGQSASSQFEAASARELAGKMLDALSAEDRVIVQMIDMEQQSVADVARLTGRSPTGVKVRAFRARRKLRKMFERLADQGIDAEASNEKENLPR